MSQAAGGSPMRTLSKVVFTLAVLSAVTYAGQQKQTMPKPGTEKSDQFEEAHRGIFAPAQDKAKEAGKLTNQVAGKLPAAGKAFEKTPRKNFIDDIVFGK